MNRMRILWFEVTTPSSYVSGGPPIGGWQDSLERIVRTIPEIELVIAFVSEKYSDVKICDGVKYVPIYTKWSFYERYFKKYWDVYLNKMLPSAKRIIDDCKPDLIHVFGTEWPFGQIASITNIPVVIHLQGAIVPYNNASYPPGFSIYDEVFIQMFAPKKLFAIWRNKRDCRNREDWERKTWKLVQNYMGRTSWDEALSAIMHTNCKYFHVEEALRTDFFDTKKKWLSSDSTKLRLVSTGCSTFWKGPDMLLKVASILKKMDINFEWNVVGDMPYDLKLLVEKKIHIKFSDCNVNFLGFMSSDSLSMLLCSSTIYVHTAYIENSPNSICEAQCLGVPIVAANVGGISSLVCHDEEGLLVPANDPWQMAYAILRLSEDPERMQRYSQNSRKRALTRHHDENIRTQLIECYYSIINNTETP